MNERALHLQEAVDRFVELEKSAFAREERRAARNASYSSQQRQSSAIDMLDTEGWAVLTEYKQMLQPIWRAIMRLEGDALEGRNGAIWEVLSAFEYTLDIFHTLDARYKLDTNPTTQKLRTSLQLGIDKLDSYYQHLDDTPAYYAAVILRPQFKWG